MAVYLDLFLINNVATNDAAHLTWKVPVAATSVGLATWVAATRVQDHRHDLLDVSVGAAVGTGISTLIYGLHQNWFGDFYRDQDKGDSVAKTLPRLMVLPQPNGFSIYHRF